MIGEQKKRKCQKTVTFHTCAEDSRIQLYRVSNSHIIGELVEVMDTINSVEEDDEEVNYF